jgi:lysine 2,3-aminomutase
MADDSTNPALILRHADDLARLPIDSQERASLQRAAETYNVRAPRPYLQRVRWDDPRDPVRLQVIPSADELEWDPREQEDPIGDEARSPVPRLTHRYPDRVLLYPTYQCAVYCRHCFRKESLSDAVDQFAEDALEPALAYIAAHTEIREGRPPGALQRSPRVAARARRVDRARAPAAPAHPRPRGDARARDE